MKFKIQLLISILTCLILSAMYADDFSVEDYGMLPNIKSVSISPDGKHYAFIKEVDDGTIFAIVNVKENKMVGGANSGDLKARSIYFATNEHVIISASKKNRSMRIRGAWEQNTSVVFNLKTKKLLPIHKRVKNLFIAQGGLGRIVGVNSKENIVYMPAYIGSSEPKNNLFKVNLDTLNARVHAKGNNHVVDWFVDKNGEVLAREEFHQRKQLHKIVSYTSGKREIIYELATEIPEIGVVAVSEDGQKLIFESTEGNFDAVYSMSLSDGKIAGPLYEEENTDIDAILSNDRNREITGIKYSGLLPNYQYLDDSLQNNLGAIQSAFPKSAIHPVSMTTDKSKIVIKVSGNGAANIYAMYDAAINNMKLIGSGYPNIKVEQIAEVKAIKYKARDGLGITAILTKPVSNPNAINLPLIVMPHGGPESYSSIEFDWWAQFLARKGYLVLQPNFRGSSGFGSDFTQAGYGKWGQEMQDDVTDGVNTLVKAGYADPERVCIMGASYGGYSALAGGVFTPELYRCVIAVAGVSDLPLMLKNEKYTSGSRNWVVSYWHKVIGNSKTEKEKLKSVSPVNLVDKFQAPLLLLHGKDDTVVSIKQSSRMYKAMKKAGKNVEMITLKGEDHWLSGSETRLSLLEKISDFLDEHNPAVID